MPICSSQPRSCRLRYFLLLSGSEPAHLSAYIAPLLRASLQSRQQQNGRGPRLTLEGTGMISAATRGMSTTISPLEMQCSAHPEVPGHREHAERCTWPRMLPSPFRRLSTSEAKQATPVPLASAGGFDDGLNATKRNDPISLSQNGAVRPLLTSYLRSRSGRTSQVQDPHRPGQRPKRPWFTHLDRRQLPRRIPS